MIPSVLLLPNAQLRLWERRATLEVRRFLRAIATLALALSVAALPAAKTFATAAGSQQEISIPASDCSSHHDGSADHTSKALADCASMAACPGMCLNYVATALFVVGPHPMPAVTEPLRVGNDMPSLIGSPPDRPPRT